MRQAASLSDWAQERYREEIRPGRLVAELDTTVTALVAEQAGRGRAVRLLDTFGPGKRLAARRRHKLCAARWRDDRGRARASQLCLPRDRRSLHRERAHVVLREAVATADPAL